MSVQLPKDVINLLEGIFKENITDFDIEQDEEKGQGFLSNIFLVLLRHKKTGQDHHLVVKKVVSCNTVCTMNFLSGTYKNEIYFYEQYIPELIQFQKSYAAVELFQNIPTCLGTSLEKGNEKVVLENLMFKNYEAHPKQAPVTNKMYEEIFKLYGKYHGVSYAFKTHHPEKYLQLANAFQNSYMFLVHHGLMVRSVQDICQTINELLKTESRPLIAEKFKKFSITALESYIKSLTYKGPHCVVVHGDLWSNNLMFKYNDKRDIEDIKILDFQMTMLGTPILDLSYGLYSGATKDTLDNWDQLLQVYYLNLCETLKAYNLIPEDVLLYEDLKQDWKEYNGFGFIMGLIMWRSKNEVRSEQPTFSEVMDTNLDESDIKKDAILKMDAAAFKKPCVDLIVHMCDNDFL